MTELVSKVIGYALEGTLDNVEKVSKVLASVQIGSVDNHVKASKILAYAMISLNGSPARRRVESSAMVGRIRRAPA